MAEDMGLMDALEVETGAEEVESGAEQIESGTEQIEGAESGAEQAQAKDDPYTTKFSREMRTALKAWEAANPEAAKYARQARDNHARLFALTQLEPKGIDGVREKYALLDGLSRGDFKGPEALTAIQDELASVEEVDRLLASGDPKAFDALGDDFNAGLAKLAPAYLDRIQKTDPAAFEAAITPHVVSTLANSDLVREYNALVDVLNAQNDPRFDDKTKMQFAITQLGKMGQWLNGLAEKGAAPVAAKPDGQREQFEQERNQFEEERQKAHWETKIYPSVRKEASDKFAEQLAPLQKRLNLNPVQKESAFGDFKAKLARLMESDKEYERQYNAYRKQKGPDAAAVTNFVRLNIAKRAKEAFDQVKEERWGGFLAGKPKTAPVVQPQNGVKPKTSGPVPVNVEVRSVKPPMNEIDHRNTPIAWLPMKQYRLYSGKVVRVVNQ